MSLKLTTDGKFTTGQELYDLAIAGDYNKSVVKQLSDGVLAGLKTDLELKDFNSFCATNYIIFIAFPTTNRKVVINPQRINKKW